ncbi:hypothetical protein AAHK20_04335 [Trinickia sp. YCB016]
MNYIKISKLAFLILGIMAVCPTWSQGKFVIPRSEQAHGAYLSTQLLLKPCSDVGVSGFDLDDNSIKHDVAEARKALPPGTCNNPALVEKLFKARFLQYASIAVVNDPWSLDAKIKAQNRVIGRCGNTHCLDSELNAVIDTLSPVYVEANPTSRDGRLCDADPVDTSIAKALTPFDAAVSKEFSIACGGADVIARTCHGPRGRLLFVRCAMEGSQVNTSEWLFHMRHARLERLLAIDDGPFSVLETVCNGMPDLVTSARMNMGEHSYAYYRYDGKRYLPVYGYTRMSVGTDDNRNDIGIAVDGGPIAKVRCR